MLEGPLSTKVGKTSLLTTSASLPLTKQGLCLSKLVQQTIEVGLPQLPHVAKCLD